jgi:hypothetical protein
MPDDRSFDDPRPPTEEEWGTPLVEPRSAPELEEQFRRRVGMVSGAVPYVAPHPWLYRPFLFLSDPALAALPEDLAASISFIIARDNSCRFCYSTFRTLLRLSNYSASELQNLETRFSAQGFDEAEEWGLRFAVRLSRCEHVPQALDQLRELDHPPTAVREMAGISVLNVAANRIGTTLSIPLGRFEDMGEKWYLRPWWVLTQSLLALTGGGRDGASGPTGTAPEGLLAPWVDTVRDTPVGAILDRLAEQWLSDNRALARRTKLLMLAVVARGIPAPQLEATVQATLREDHSVSETAFEAAVDHFGGAAVDAAAEPRLRLARASIRYDFGPIKRIARNCTRDLDRAGTLETLASIGLANAVARLELLFPLENS